MACNPAAINGQEVRRAASRAYKRAKEALKQRLAYLAESVDHEYLLHHLCSIAISCDVLKKRKIFTNSKSYELIVQGFAQVKKLEINGRKMPVAELAEQVAIDAAIEWFREIRFEQYRNAMIEFLETNAISPTNFGNAAEYFLPVVRSATIYLN